MSKPAEKEKEKDKEVKEKPEKEIRGINLRTDAPDGLCSTKFTSEWGW